MAMPDVALAGGVQKAAKQRQSRLEAERKAIAQWLAAALKSVLRNAIIARLSSDERSSPKSNIIPLRFATGAESLERSVFIFKP